MKKLILTVLLSLSGVVAATAQPMCCYNPVLNCIATRTSVRQYAPTAIPDSVTTTLLQAAMCAPSAVNKQPWEFITVTNPEVRTAIKQAIPNSHAAKAPLCIVVCGDMNQALEGQARDFWVQDCSAATQNILLAAHSMGLGGVWCGVYPNTDRCEALRKVLKIPANVIPLNVVCLGYPDPNAPAPTPKDKFKPAKIHVNAW